MTQVLIVDDDAGTRECLTELFRLHGHETAACGSAEAALAMLGWVDAVVCDGLEGACFRVIAEAERLGNPAVIYTASDAVHETAATLGVPCVMKPVGVAELLEALSLREAVRT
jgi:CheY-like chemotaxis protein